MLNETTSFLEFKTKLKSCANFPAKYIEWIVNRFESKEFKIHSFLEDEKRSERLLNELHSVLKYNDSEKSFFFGIPVGIKDLFNVDGFETKCGSKLPSNLFKSEEAEIVTKIKKTGALILGKTVTTEFAYFEPGPTKNPNNDEYTPGGSSSGSAAAVSAGLCPFAFGTQTIGSIIRPAAFCGITGFKPTLGRVSTKGVFPFSSTFDHIGFFTSNVLDMKFASSELVDNWNNSPIIKEKPIIAIPAGKYLEQAEKDVLEVFYSKIDILKKAGFEIFEFNIFENIELINDEHKAICAVEIAHTHKKIFNEFKALYRSKTVEIIESGLKINRDEYLKMKMRNSILKSKFDEIVKIKGIDLFLSPATVSYPTLGIECTDSPIMNLPWTYMGTPAISIPYFRNNNNLPLGLQITSFVNNDEALLEYALKFEKIFNYQ